MRKQSQRAYYIVTVQGNKLYSPLLAIHHRLQSYTTSTTAVNSSI